MTYFIPGYIKVKEKLDNFYIINNVDKSILELENEYLNDLKKFFKYGTENIDSELKKFLYNNHVLLTISETKQYLNNFFKYMENTLEITILITEQCNFRCKYCYEKFEYGEIELNDLNIIIDFIENEIKRHAFKKMHISWFGGEPLLSLDKIIYAQERINSFVKKYNMVIDSSMTTNGYLLSIQVFKKLIELNINKYQITIDGNNHNDLRVLENGEPTLNMILNNIREICDSPYDFKIYLRHNVTANDWDCSWYDVIKNIIHQDKRFKIIIEPVSDLGNLKSNLKLLYNNYDLLTKHIEYAKKIDLDVCELNFNFSTYCYAKLKNSYVFRSNGKILKCTVDLDSEYNNIEKKKNNTITMNQNKNHKLTQKYFNDRCFLCSHFLICKKIKCLKKQFDEHYECHYERAI